MWDLRQTTCHKLSSQPDMIFLSISFLQFTGTKFRKKVSLMGETTHWSPVEMYTELTVMVTVHYRQNKWQLFNFGGGGGVGCKILSGNCRRWVMQIFSLPSQHKALHRWKWVRGWGGGAGVLHRLSLSKSAQACGCAQSIMTHSYYTEPGTGPGLETMGFYIMLCCSYCTGTRTGNGNGKIVNGFWTHFSIPEMVPAWTCKHAMQS